MPPGSSGRTGEVVSDAGPLIALGRAGLLDLLHDLYARVLIPPEVLAELALEENRPGSAVLRTAVKNGWLLTEKLDASGGLEALSRTVDAGEAAAIRLAKQRKARFVLMDDRRGRRLARQQGVPVVGTAGVLLVAKQKGLISHLRPALDQLRSIGYHLSPALHQEVLRRAGEARAKKPRT